MELGEVAQLADDDIRFGCFTAEVGEDLRCGIADVCFCQDDVDAAGVKQSQIGFDRGSAPVFDVGFDGTGGGDWLGGLGVKLRTKGQGNLLTNFALASQRCFWIVDTSVENRCL